MGQVRNVIALRRFRRTVGGQLVSAVGDGAFQVALAFTVLLMSGPGALAVVLLGKSAFAVAGLLIGGVLVDRHSAKAVILWSDGIRGASVMIVAVLVVFGIRNLSELVLLGAVFGVGDGLFEPAYDAAIPLLVSAGELPAANAVASSAKRLAMLLGPPLGAIVFGSFGAAWSFAVNGLSYVVSLAATLSSGKWKEQPKDVNVARATFRVELVDGFRTVRRMRWLWSFMAASAVVVVLVFAGVFVLLPELYQERGGALGYAGVVAGAAGGGFVAAISAPLVLDRLSHIAVVYGGLVGTALFYMSVGLISQSALAIALAAVAGACTSVGNIAYVTVLQARVSGEQLGRVFAADALASYGLMPLAYVALSAAVAETSAKPLFVGACLTAAVLVALFWISSRSSAADALFGVRQPGPESPQR